MENLSSKTISELEDVLKNYENEELESIKNSATELRNRGSGIKNAILISKHFGLKDVSELFSHSKTLSSNTYSSIEINNSIQSPLSIIFKDFANSFKILLICILIAVLNGIVGAFILLNGDLLILANYSIISIFISIILFIISVFALYELYTISDSASKKLI